jgi:hypothetical protein
MARSSAALREMPRRQDIDAVIANMSCPDRDTLERLRDSSAASTKLAGIAKASWTNPSPSPRAIRPNTRGGLRL